ncbi:hypothetical protein PF003_g17743 [Phytophthora fragariae]|nr:hypothetical protein PF003_g17743 [Phytophthora fragariae]
MHSSRTAETPPLLPLPISVAAAVAGCAAAALALTAAFAACWLSVAGKSAMRCAHSRHQWPFVPQYPREVSALRCAIGRVSGGP